MWLEFMPGRLLVCGDQSSLGGVCTELCTSMSVGEGLLEAPDVEAAGELR